MNRLTMDTLNQAMDTDGGMMGSHNLTMDIYNSLMYIHNCICLVIGVYNSVTYI